MNARQKYRRFVCFLLVCATAGLCYCGWEVLRGQIPGQIQVSQEEEIPIFFSGVLGEVIETQISQSVEVASHGQASGAADYEITCSLFGAIPLKTVSVAVVPRQQLYAGGIPVGIYLETDGVLVVDTGMVTDDSGTECCPAKNIVKSGDYIQSVNGTEVNTKEELIDCIQDSEGNELILELERSGEEIRVKVKPILNQKGDYQAGIWVRNDTQGIGTLTFLKKDGTFGALGHGISDIDTGDLLEISEGSLYEAEIVSIVKGARGVPGELSGVIHYNDGYRFGEITENEENGIYGTVRGLPGLIQGRSLYETAYCQEVKKGAASILGSVDGVCREYSVEIKEVRHNGADVNKGMVIEVTDPRLLEMTGGIVQGMSGSPIIQDGKLVGAVTHVLVNSPDTGYGIFIENMLAAAS